MFYVIVYVYFSYKLVGFFFFWGGGGAMGGGVGFMCYSAGATHVHIF